MKPRILLAFLLFLLAASDVRAELQSFAILHREPFAEGAAFGATGPYEKIIGVARFAIDPAHVRNRGIVDLPLAPRNSDGKVEFEADVFILAPKDLAKGNRALLYDVNNRGNKLALRMFNNAPGINNPTTRADAGNGFLFQQGYTVVWSGWIGELLPMPSLQPDYRAGRPHGEFVTNLKLPAATVQAALARAWNADGEWANPPLAEIEKLAQEKYATYAWNHKF